MCIRDSHLSPIRGLKFIVCLEDGVSKGAGFDAAGTDCANRQGLDYSIIKFCATNTEGNLLEHKMAQQTNALNPPHRYVPWVVVNGQHNVKDESEILSNLLEYACKHSTVQIPECLNAMIQAEKKKFLSK
eukprot:TRINITY_DN0_c5852_g1_i1.p2 TRINITY_DN0_c5852_g1~~TRINITY_DN0_c5852_g1_i1.p2  ORF type:complete len:130 (-),score=34.11 TRINITY_DN0_c5852_g1_i1:38-427(-)